MIPVLRALQGGIESMYRVETELDVCDFLVGGNERDEFSPERFAREQLFVREEQSELEIALFVDERTLENLAMRDPRRRLDEHNLQDFLLAVEGVSHFVYLAHRAREERPVSAVEMELQAEIDKYLVSLLVGWNQDGEPPENLRRKLFHHVVFAGDLNREERERYALANSAANEYTATLERRYVERGAVADLLGEARRFYRKGLAQKLEHITQLSATSTLHSS